MSEKRGQHPPAGGDIGRRKSHAGPWFFNDKQCSVGQDLRPSVPWTIVLAMLSRAGCADVRSRLTAMGPQDEANKPQGIQQYIESGQPQVGQRIEFRHQQRDSTPGASLDV
jgi:hypothetical protein